MLKTFYLEIEKNSNKITDICDDQPTLGLEYVEALLDTPLPNNANCGCYKFENNSMIYVPEWDKNEERKKIAKLEEEIVDVKKANNIRLQNLAEDNLNLCEAVLNMQYQQDLKELGGEANGSK